MDLIYFLNSISSTVIIKYIGKYNSFSKLLNNSVLLSSGNLISYHSIYFKQFVIEYKYANIFNFSTLFLSYSIKYPVLYNNNKLYKCHLKSLYSRIILNCDIILTILIVKFHLLILIVYDYNVIFNTTIVETIY